MNGRLWIPGAVFTELLLCVEGEIAYLHHLLHVACVSANHFVNILVGVHIDGAVFPVKGIAHHNHVGGILALCLPEPTGNRIACCSHLTVLCQNCSELHESESTLRLQNGLVGDFEANESFLEAAIHVKQPVIVIDSYVHDRQLWGCFNDLPAIR